MSESRRSLHLGSATLAALLGLQLASCADVQSGADQAPPGILAAGPITHQTAQPPPAAVPGARAAAKPPTVGGPQIALLLPLTGRQSAAAIAVRDGFLTAYYSRPAADRPGLRIYDTAQMSVAAALTQATGDGAGLIVGPLTREEAAAAAGYGGPRPPMLILNAITGAAARRQRAVPVRTLAGGGSPPGRPARGRGRQSRRSRAGAERRVGTARARRFHPGIERRRRPAAGYRPATMPTSTDYAAAISQVLRINESESRDKRLESVLGTRLTFQPRRRGDVAFIFSPGQAQAERLLRPQLKFYFAGDVPTYATADAFEPNTNANQDLDGLIFPDAPWLLGGALVDSVRDATNAAWPTGGPTPQYSLRLRLRCRKAGDGAACQCRRKAATRPASRGRAHRPPHHRRRRSRAARPHVGADPQRRAAAAELKQPVTAAQMLGARAEQIAADYLQGRGLTILERNLPAAAGRN